MNLEMSNGERIIANIINAENEILVCGWEDENGPYHDSGWNESWPDGWRDSHK
ncbi:MAG: hypothetical protein PHT78_09990 [Desulfitobacteriaceae bacterium]|nr:hypothetical protein [Desulfitobacteriaceae bacterium]